MFSQQVRVKQVRNFRKRTGVSITSALGFVDCKLDRDGISQEQIGETLYRLRQANIQQGAEIQRLRDKLSSVSKSLNQELESLAEFVEDSE